MRIISNVIGITLLAACGVPSDPEKGSVVLLCEGQYYLKAANGEEERKRLTRFYKVDGQERTLEEWDDNQQRWMGSTSKVSISPTQINRVGEPTEMAGILSAKTITIDRIAGRLHDEITFSNGGMITFDGPCKPVKSPTSEKKF